VRPVAARLGSLVTIRTGKLDANASVKDGEYPFFTCAVSPLRIDKFAFDGKAVLVAGNGDLNVKYYEGKFNAYQRTYVIQSLDENKLLPAFMAAFLEQYLEPLRRLSVGGVIKYIRLANLSDALIPLPPLDEQRRITTLLSELSQIRFQRHRTLQLLEKLPSSLFFAMFGDPISTASSWEKKRLGSVVSKIGSGATPRGGESVYKDTGTTLIRSMNVHDGEFKREGLAYIDDAQAQKLWGVVVHENDVLLNITGASVARVCRAPMSVTPARVNQHVAIIRPTGEVMPEFLEALLLSPSVKTCLLRIAKAGATREAITKSQIEALEIIVPPIVLQEQFRKGIESVIAAKDVARRHFDSLDRLFTALQGGAFSDAGTRADHAAV
jgi:type I restriction enzyme, S subunit